MSDTPTPDEFRALAALTEDTVDRYPALWGSKTADLLRAVAAALRVAAALAAAPKRTFKSRCADALADACEAAVKRGSHHGGIDSRSPIADALLDYRDLGEDKPAVRFEVCGSCQGSVYVDGVGPRFDPCPHCGPASHPQAGPGVRAVTR